MDPPVDSEDVARVIPLRRRHAAGEVSQLTQPRTLPPEAAPFDPELEPRAVANPPRRSRSARTRLTDIRPRVAGVARAGRRVLAASVAACCVAILGFVLLLHTEGSPVRRAAVQTGAALPTILRPATHHRSAVSRRPATQHRTRATHHPRRPRRTERAGHPSRGSAQAVTATIAAQSSGSSPSPTSATSSTDSTVAQSVQDTSSGSTGSSSQSSGSSASSSQSSGSRPAFGANGTLGPGSSPNG